MYRRGIVSQVDPEEMQVKVKFPDRGGVETPWLDVAVRGAKDNKDEWLPDLGELVALVLDENETSGCVLGSTYTKDTRPASPSIDVRRFTFSDGSEFKYDRSTQTLSVNLGASGAAEFAVQLFKVIGAVEVDGTVKVGAGAEKMAGADKTDARLDALEQFAANHTHSGVSPGASATAPATGAPSGSTVAMEALSSD